jgi:hypothetical protein
VGLPRADGGPRVLVGAAIGVASRGVYFNDGQQIDFTPLSNAAAPEAAQSSGVLQSGLSGSNAGPLVVDSTSLYFFGAMGGGSGPYYVGALPLSGGPPSVLRVIDNGLPLDAWAIPAQGLLWLEAPQGSLDGPTALWLWNGIVPALVATITEPPLGVAGDAKHALVMTRTHLFDVALPGGSPLAVRTLGVSPRILGWYEGSLFYTPDGSTVVRRDVDAGHEVVLASEPDLTEGFVAEGHFGWADSQFLYYFTSTGGNPAALRRVPIDGGAPETLWDDPGHPPAGAVATDACNVYWLTASAPWGGAGTLSTVGPSLLMVRAKR